MKRALLKGFSLTSLLACAVLFGAEDDGLLFYCDYNGTADAAFAVGDKTATCAIPPEFQPGVSGQAVVIGGDPKVEQRVVDGLPVSDKKARNCVYSSKGNLDFEQGTISFWVQPLDWKGTDPDFNVLFHARAGDNLFLIYRYWRDTRLLFLIGSGKSTSTYLRVDDWGPGQWHHIAATWSPMELRMFIDGHLICRRKRACPLKPFSKADPFSVGPGGAWSHAFIGHSLVDEFRIHNRPLTDEEIIGLFRRDADKVELASDVIVLGEKTPKLDDRIDDFEYAFDTCVGLTPKGMSFSMEQIRLALSYDESNLYVAAKSNLKRTAEGKSQDKDGEASTLERVDLFLRPDGKKTTMYKFAFDPTGKVTAVKEGDPAWKAGDIQIENADGNGTWLFEAAIPFSSFGLDGPPNGRQWRANVVCEYAQPAREVSLAPVVGSVDDVSHFIALSFRPDAPAIRVADWKDENKRKSGEDVSVYGADDQADIRYEVVSDTTKHYGLKSRSHTLFANGKSTRYQSPAWSSGGADFLMQVDRKIVERVGGEKEILYRKKYVNESSNPLDIRYMCTRGKKRMMVSALRKAKGGEIQVRFLEKDGSCAFKASQPLPADSSYFDAFFDLDFDKLRPGTYTVEYDYVAPDGTISKLCDQEYRIPAPDDPDFQPYVDEEAGKAPAPWTPVKLVKADANEVQISIWGRSYVFSKNILFSSLVSQGEELLTAPAVLRLNGKTLIPTEPVTLTAPKANRETSVAWTQTAKLGALNAASRIDVHFDGYCEVAMTLSPTPSTPEIKTLSLDIPMRGAAATIVRDNRINKMAGGKTGKVGNYWCQGMPSPRWGSFFWVGNDKVGFNWQAPNLDGWHSETEGKQVEMIRDGNKLTLRFNLIDTPLKLEEPRTIKFCFTLTPSHPLNRKILRRRNQKDFQLWCQPWQYFAVTDYDAADKGVINRQLKKAEPGADEVFLYMGVGLTSPFSPEWPWFAEEWNPGKEGEWVSRKIPRAFEHKSSGYTGGSIGVDSFFNWMQHSRAKFFEKAKKPLTPEGHSYYFDTGCSTKQRYREQAINVYRMIRRTGPDARICGHQGFLRTIPMQHFADMLLGGEAFSDASLDGDPDYFDALTPEMFRATFSPYIWGMKMIFIDMYVRWLKESHPKKFLNFDINDPEYRRPLLHSYGYCLTHDVDIMDSHKESRPLRLAIWAAQDAIGWDENVEFFPYWENDAVKLVSPQSDRILASAFSNNGKLLLAVLNDTDQPQNVKLDLNLENLGVKPGLNGEDAFEKGKRYVLGNSWEDTIPPRGFRLISWPKANAETPKSTK